MNQGEKTTTGKGPDDTIEFPDAEAGLHPKKKRGGWLHALPGLKGPHDLMVVRALLVFGCLELPSRLDGGVTTTPLLGAIPFSLDP